MRDDAERSGSTPTARFRERWRDRRVRRAWRRERRKGVLNLHDSANQAESRLYRGGFFTKR